MIPFKKLDFSKASPWVSELLTTGYIGLGEVVTAFEKELAEYLGVKHVVATDSCTSALFLSLKYNEIGGDQIEVGIPSMTVPLVAAAAKEARRKIYFTNDTNWVGSAYKLLGTNVYDSAHQLERNQCANIGPNDKYCFSFYPTKPIGSADGGAIATNDSEFADWARSMITYGRENKSKYGNSWEYEVIRVGYKRHYTNLQAAICLEQLRRLDETNQRRTEIRDYFNEKLELNNRSLYLYRIDVPNRDKFIELLKAHGIECGVHFKPLHIFKAFRDVEISPETIVEVERAYRTTVSLPFHEHLSQEDLDYIIQSVQIYLSGGNSQ